MKTSGLRHVYGPVFSRRLGRSLGIDLVPFKTCTYDCVYCQLGRTTNKTIERREYVAVGDILAELERKLSAGDAPDYISLAGSGEPTLNSGIGDLIHRIRKLTDIPLTVLTNGSLLWMPEVQEDLMAADVVLPSLDAGDEFLFQYVNRPHTAISFEHMVDGLAGFTRRFPGEVWLEVLLLAGVTGIPAEVQKIAALTEKIGAARVQLNTVSRPPAEDFALALDTDQLLALKALIPGVVDIISESKLGETQPSLSSPAREAEILALLGRRPCTPEDVARGLGIHLTEAIKHLEALAASGKVRTVVADRRNYYVLTQSAKIDR
jgi:wyosine [tRNA(Phe)-imidazoG37] synthetase (radical SAM superfamily)